jgi:hypothetical protein
MAKKHPIALQKKNIIFEKENSSYKLLCFYPATMEVELQDMLSKKIFRSPFAHLPKKIKQIIKPI